MKPSSAPHVPGNGSWEKLDVRKVFSVSKETLVKEETTRTRARARKRARRAKTEQ